MRESHKNLCWGEGSKDWNPPFLKCALTAISSDELPLRYAQSDLLVVSENSPIWPGGLRRQVGHFLEGLAFKKVLTCRLEALRTGYLWPGHNLTIAPVAAVVKGRISD